MKPNNKLVVLLSLLVLAVIGTSGTALWLSLLKSRGITTKTVSTRSTTAAPAPDKKPIRPEKTKPAPLTGTVTQDAAAEAEEPAPAKKLRRTDKNKDKKPQLTDSNQQLVRQALQHLYAPLLSQLGLTPEEEQRFFELLSDPAGDSRKEKEEGRKQNEQELAALLGQERYAAYQGYVNSLADRFRLDAHGAQVAGTAAELSADQYQKLLDVIAQTKSDLGIQSPVVSRSSTTGTGFQVTTMAGGSPQSQQQLYQNVVNQAAAFLNNEQLTSLASHFEEQVAQQEAAIAAALQGGGKTKVKTTPRQ